MSSFAHFLTLLAAMLCASGFSSALGLSLGPWFFAACCVLSSSPQACHSLTSSVAVVAALVRELVDVFRDTTMANLHAQIRAFADATTDTSSTTYSEAYQQLKKDHEVLQCVCDDSKASIEALQLGIQKAQSQLRMIERHYNVDAVEADREESRRQRRMLELELAAKGREVERLQEAEEGRKGSAAKASGDLYSLASKNDELQKALDRSSKALNNLVDDTNALRRDLYQKEIQAAMFTSFKEIIHQMTEAGGDRMVISVLFLRCLAESRVDLAQLGVDEAQFLTYSDYAIAMVQGRQSPLFPQGGLRLKGIQYPISGLRVVGTKILEAGNCSLVRSSEAPVMGFTTFSAHAAPSFSAPPPTASEAPKVSRPAPAPAPAPVSAPSSGFAAAAAPPMPPSPTAKASAPKQNETKAVTFQQSKAPGSFGVKGKGRA
ncbi:hypothetical protein N0V83_001048 [Neocucurbitaria cava]|uniref:Uncharacterized protein n=1 Tax=Neocucurbitaria cava TaxID=798079 RepID=A0A9W9CQ38_9PLEO|nr:hypothetical protein N0V83_001048 [Neocucurbitaria cava]